MTTSIILKIINLFISSLLSVSIFNANTILLQYKVETYKKEVAYKQEQDEEKRKAEEQRKIEEQKRLEEEEKKKEQRILLEKQKAKEKAKKSPTSPTTQNPKPSKPIQPTSKNIVYPNQVYTYNIMENDIKELANRYPDIIKYKSIGKSEMGKDIYAVSLGTGKTTIFINGAHHGREWISTVISMQMIEEYAKAYKNNSSIDGYKAKEILSNTTIWFVPMVNPDGVTLQQKGLSAFPKSIHSDLIAMNKGRTDFSSWKANIHGVDLNRQYDADWENIKDNVGKPYYQMFKGNAPSTASEVKSIINFTYEIKPEIAVAYHSSGRILYWNFHQNTYNYNRDHVIAKQIGKMTGYSLVYPGPNPSGGGYTDWFLITFNKPAFTPELAPWLFENSPPISVFANEWERNKAVGLYLAEEGHKLSKQ